MPCEPQVTDDLIANLRPETFQQLDASLHNPLRATLRAAHDANIENFDLDAFAHGLCGIAISSREKIYFALADIGINNQNNTHQSTDGDKATNAQKRTILRFNLNPDPTKGEASGIISAFIEKIEKRLAAASNSSSPASPA